ncbi:putative translocation protein sec63 [Erysiphe necator]|uniref:Putative translocation protein sec63 n=1 Tax=Uncinula necator TaxID=52586 RepID=A0A0B1NWM6_UNCNE|nr:putative translocation protein sec63 [Erysiphe necator]
MSGTDYSYDDQGQFFPFFFLTITSIITIPLTYSLLKPNSNTGATASRIKTEFRPKHADLVDVLKKAQKRRELKLKQIYTVTLGWIIIAGMFYLIAVTSKTVPKIWNPYDILGISESATEKQIKSHYRRMSLKFHPDKVRPDTSKNETIQSLNDYFVELTKAYKALTDEEIRNNYAQYGHPDGKQSVSIGIALPKFLITDGNGKYVLLLYAIMLGFFLPYVVGSWWYGTQRISKEKVLLESANKLFREYKESITMGEIFSALSSGLEFHDIFKNHKSELELERVESKIFAPDNTYDSESLACGMTKKNQKELQAMEFGIRRKTLGLLWAYLGRIELDDKALNRKKLEIAPIAHSLTVSFTAISFAFGSTTPVLKSYLAAQCIIQAIPPGGSPLLQLPYFNKSIIKEIEGDSKNHFTIQRYMKLPRLYRRKISIGKGLLTEAQYKVVTTFARQLPRLHVEKVFFKVTGEKFITTNSLVTLVVKGRIIPPGSHNVPKVEETDLEDIDPDEDDLDALLGRKKITGKDGTLKEQSKSHQPPLAYSPFFARDYSPRWHIFLADSKQGKIAVPPFTFSTFDKSLFDEDGKPTFNVQTLKAQFQAPSQAGHYNFSMHLICDSYIGFDTRMDVTLMVEDSSKAVEIQAEDDISEPDEDSIAGQMNALKAGGIMSSSVKKKRISKDSSDEESDTDGEAREDSEDTSETDTETDED